MGFRLAGLSFGGFSLFAFDRVLGIGSIPMGPKNMTEIT
jgi:hypothetical protein